MLRDQAIKHQAVTTPRNNTGFRLFLQLRENVTNVCYAEFVLVGLVACFTSRWTDQRGRPSHSLVGVTVQPNFSREETQHAYKSRNLNGLFRKISSGLTYLRSVLISRCKDWRAIVRSEAPASASAVITPARNEWPPYFVASNPIRFTDCCTISPILSAPSGNACGKSPNRENNGPGNNPRAAIQAFRQSIADVSGRLL